MIAFIQSKAKRFRRCRCVAAAIFALLVPFAGVARAALGYTIAFDDPRRIYSGYYDGIRRNLIGAGEEWGRHFHATAVIHIQVTFTDESTMSASSLAFNDSYVTTIQGQNVFRLRAAAKLVGALDPIDSGVDAILGIGVTPSTVAPHGYLQDVLWFDPDPSTRTAPIPEDRMDAYSDFLHELGHIFAFDGYLDLDTGKPKRERISMFDRYVVRRVDGRGARPITNYYFTGPAARAVYGSDVPLTFGGSVAVYHFGNNAPRPGSDLNTRERREVMSGDASFWSTRFNLSSLDLAVCTDVGLPTLESCPVQEMQPATKQRITGPAKYNGTAQAIAIVSAVGFIAIFCRRIVLVPRRRSER